MNIPANLKYSNDHEWCRVEGDTVYIGGEVLEFNSAVDADPAVVNKDPYGEGWIIKVRFTEPADFEALLSAEQYKELIG